MAAEELAMPPRLAAIVIAVSILVGCDTKVGSSPNAAPTAQSKPTVEYSKYSMAAEDVVKKFVTHPLDARFNPGMLNVADVIPIGTDGQVRVSGNVVAKNDFGMELTHTYVVLFGDDSSVVAVTLDGEFVYASEDEPVSDNEPPRDEFRLWLDDTGQHSVEAVFVEFKGGKVHLRKRDGQTVELAPSRLSENDIRWYRDELKRRKSAKP
jgi:hypothetical protein